MAEEDFTRLAGVPRSLENTWARRMNADRGSHATANAY
jgi:hypothetical protein